VFQWFPLHILITAEPILLRCTFDKQHLFCLMRHKQFWSYFVSSCTHLLQVITFQVWNAWPTQLTVRQMTNLNVGKLLVLVSICLRCEKNRLSYNFKLQHVVSLYIVLVMWPFVFYQCQNSHNIYFASWGKIDSIFLIWLTWKFL